MDKFDSKPQSTPLSATREQKVNALHHPPISKGPAAVNKPKIDSITNRQASAPKIPHSHDTVIPVISPAPKRPRVSHLVHTPPVQDLTDGDHLTFDKNAIDTWIYPSNVSRRTYQVEIVQSALTANTLVCLPTGLGKTLIAAVLMYNYLRWFPAGKVVFMAASKILVNQQMIACQQIIEKDLMSEMTGATSPAKRSNPWQEKRLFFLSPHVFVNDLKSGMCPGQKIVCIVFDEAHKAQGNHAYVQVMQQLSNIHKNFRVLALSASPGANSAALQSLVNNLMINNIEVRTEERDDVKEYLHNREIEVIPVSLGTLTEVKTELEAVLHGAVNDLVSSGVYYDRNVQKGSKYKLLVARDAWRTKISVTKDYSDQNLIASIEGNFAIGMTLFHAYSLLLQHGLEPFIAFVKKKAQTTRNNKEKELFCSPQWKNVMKLAESHYGGSSNHPKLSKLEEIVKEHFETQPDSRVMIFTQYRDSVNDIALLLKSCEPLVHVMTLVGQSKERGGPGLSQKEQIQILNDFRKGLYNTLVATCIGEEGLDIGDVDLIVCFDAHLSPTRLVQRMGRTGRKRDGRVVMLVTEGPEQETYFKSKQRANTMYKRLSNTASLMMYPDVPRMIPEDIQPKLVETPLGEESVIRNVSETVSFQAPNSCRASKPLGTGGLTEDQRMYLISTYGFTTSHEIALSKNSASACHSIPTPVSKVPHSSRTLSLIRLSRFIQERNASDDTYSTQMTALYKSKDLQGKYSKTQKSSESESGSEGEGDIPSEGESENRYDTHIYNTSHTNIHPTRLESAAKISGISSTKESKDDAANVLAHPRKSFPKPLNTELPTGNHSNIPVTPISTSPLNCDMAEFDPWSVGGVVHNSTSTSTSTSTSVSISPSTSTSSKLCEPRNLQHNTDNISYQHPQLASTDFSENEKSTTNHGSSGLDSRGCDSPQFPQVIGVTDNEDLSGTNSPFTLSPSCIPHNDSPPLSPVLPVDLPATQDLEIPSPPTNIHNLSTDSQAEPPLSPHTENGSKPNASPAPLFISPATESKTSPAAKAPQLTPVSKPFSRRRRLKTPPSSSKSPQEEQPRKKESLDANNNDTYLDDEAVNVDNPLNDDDESEEEEYEGETDGIIANYSCSSQATSPASMHALYLNSLSSQRLPRGFTAHKIQNKFTNSMRQVAEKLEREMKAKKEAVKSEADNSKEVESSTEKVAEKQLGSCASLLKSVTPPADQQCTDENASNLKNPVDADSTEGGTHTVSSLHHTTKVCTRSSTIFAAQEEFRYVDTRSVVKLLSAMSHDSVVVSVISCFDCTHGSSFLMGTTESPICIVRLFPSVLINSPSRADSVIALTHKYNNIHVIIERDRSQNRDTGRKGTSIPALQALQNTAGIILLDSNSPEDTADIIMGIADLAPEETIPPKHTPSSISQFIADHHSDINLLQDCPVVTFQAALQILASEVDIDSVLQGNMTAEAIAEQSGVPLTTARQVVSFFHPLLPSQTSDFFS
ncbi:Fanconi anemia group M protein [Pelomyxa schiedti]|nr:Fanconi anemia group M protein [Pelomyxa schiedti]